MIDVKKTIEEIIAEAQREKTSPYKVWDSIKRLKEEYVYQYSEQSWHTYIGNKFQNVVYALIKGSIKTTKENDDKFSGLDILTESEVKKNSIIKRKLSIEYGNFLLLPDIDSTIVWIDDKQPWESTILAIISCKTSLRERIAQPCYWKLKLRSSNITRNIKLFLATTDNDDDFAIMQSSQRFEGMTRNRVIGEYELNGIYILRADFSDNWESKIVKKFDSIYSDIIEIVKNR